MVMLVRPFLFSSAALMLGAKVLRKLAERDRTMTTSHGIFYCFRDSMC
jgi:hypothetical protein